jgi:hypothetical protein
MHTPIRVKKGTRVKKLAKLAKNNASALADLAAKGREDAAVELYRTAVLTTHWLTYLCRKNPAQFSAIAGNEFSWPVLYGPHRDEKEEADELIKKLQVGARTGFNLSSGKRFSLVDNPANVVALNLYKLAQSLRRAPMRLWTLRDFISIAACGIGRRSAKQIHVYDAKYEEQLKRLKEWGQRGAGKCLPSLSRQTSREWWTATKKLFEIAYPGNFDQHPNLQGLRTQILGRARTWKRELGGPGIIRARMLGAVKQALYSIATLD